MPFDTLVSFHDFFCVNGQPFVWVHHHTKKTGVCLREKEIHCKTSGEITDSIHEESTK